MNKPQIGVGVIIIKDMQVLLGYRVNSHGEGSWGFAGGHLEFGESPEQCAIREVKEETGLDIEDIKRGPWSNDYFPLENKHYITLFMLATYKSGQVQLLEPDKCKEWCWFDMDNLPDALFLPIANLLSRYGKMMDVVNYT